MVENLNGEPFEKPAQMFIFKYELLHGLRLLTCYIESCLVGAPKMSFPLLDWAVGKPHESILKFIFCFCWAGPNQTLSSQLSSK